MSIFWTPFYWCSKSTTSQNVPVTQTNKETNKLNNFLFGQNFNSGAKNCKAVQELSFFLWIPNFHKCIYKRALLDRIISQIQPPIYKRALLDRIISQIQPPIYRRALLDRIISQIQPPIYRRALLDRIISQIQPPIY